ncbi:MAG: gamma-glutamyl-gamma-aminobutyrate hydrolase family protein [Firmicutes bacterium]|jgi:putative glutamine amidotransferase|nr:gamma-glutamyl-gamma-aminobutyrate hydrolase family protein [Bacillota bacterium]
MQPVIALTSDFELEPRDRCVLCADYVKAVHMADGLPIIIPPDLSRGSPGTLAREVCGVADGIVLTGGGDLDPRWFGEPPRPGLKNVNPVRDEFELILARAAIGLHLPILAICRGMQVLNVAAGGTLVQDIQTQISGAFEHFVPAPRWHLTHSVSVAGGTALERMFGEEGLWVNSFHHQCVAEAAPGFRVSATSADGVVEAIEKPGPEFVVGVQWHPECLVERHPVFLELFRELVRAAQGLC